VLRGGELMVLLNIVLEQKTVLKNEQRPTKQKLTVCIPKNIANKSVLEGYPWAEPQEYKQSGPLFRTMIELPHCERMFADTSKVK